MTASEGESSSKQEDKTHKTKGRKGSIRDVEIYKICNKSYPVCNDNMVLCDKCKRHSCITCLSWGVSELKLKKKLVCCFSVLRNAMKRY